MAPEARYVYVMKDETGLCKVGMSKNLKQRLVGVRVEAARRVTLVWNSPEPSIYAEWIEREAHRRLVEFREVGEWFRVDDSVAVKACEEAVFAAQTGELLFERGPLKCQGRSREGEAMTLRLPTDMRERIRALTGNRQMNVFIREAVANELARREAEQL